MNRQSNLEKTKQRWRQQNDFKTHKALLLKIAWHFH
jgi:hypothetical protein